MNKTYFKCSSRLVILIFSLQILFNSCSDKNDFFNEKITIIENNPDKFLAQFDTTHQSNITDEHGATLYLLKSLAKYHLNPMNKPIKTEITQCIEIFYNTKSYNKLLKSLLVLAEIYKHENDIEHEIETIKEAIDIASANDDNIGLFYLYNYLSNMYNRQYDLVEYSRYQSLVNKYSENIDIALTNIETKLIIAQNKIYTHDIDNAIKILNIIEKEIKDSDINYIEFRRVFSIAYSMQKEWHSCIKQVEESIKYEKEESNLFTCYTILTYCYNKLDDKEKSIYYRDKAIANIEKNKDNLTKARFYEISADIAKKEGNQNEEILYLRSLSGIYEDIIRKLNTSTLDEIIESYNTSLERKKRLYVENIYQNVVIVILILLIMTLILSYRLKRKELYGIINLQKQLSLLEQIESENIKIKNEAKYLILKDLEISKQIALLKHTQKEKYNKITKELSNLFTKEEINLNSIDWDKYYKYIDIYFDNFYQNIIHRYPDFNEKEIQICCMLIAGFKTDEIAAIWQQSVFSVHKYKTNIRKKINAPEGADILVYFKDEGVLQPA